MAARIEVYEDRAGEYRWRRISVNERVIAESGEGYVSKLDAVKMAKQISPGLEIFLIEQEPLPPPE